MSHVAPHRWAEAEAGRVSGAERSRMEAHAATCARCATARERITGARAAFEGIATAAPPELRWDHIGARIYWSVSSERRAKDRTTREQKAMAPRRRWWVAAPVAAAMAAAGWLAYAQLASTSSPASAPSHELATSPAPTASEPVPVELVEMGPPATPLSGLITLAQGDLDIDGITGTGTLLAHPLVAGTVVRTSDGKASVQFGDGSAFAVGPQTVLTVRRFDGAAVELVVDGDVAVEISHRVAGQRFVVIAGDRTVEVRGTAFRVEHRDRTVTVSCEHGVVAVSGGGGSGGEASVDVAGGRRLSVADGEPLLARAVVPLDAPSLAALIAAQPHQLPVWTDPAALRRTSSPLTVAASARRAVRVDGQVVGSGTLTLRVMSGRHLVEAEAAPGRWQRAEWVEARGGGEARVEPGKAAAPAGPATDAGRVARDARRRQLRRNLDHDQLRGCLRALEKQGMAEGSFVVLELGVDAGGAVEWLNVGDTNLPPAISACVRDVAATVAFPRGAAASLAERIEF